MPITMQTHMVNILSLVILKLSRLAFDAVLYPEIRKSPLPSPTIMPSTITTTAANISTIWLYIPIDSPIIIKT